LACRSILLNSDYEIGLNYLGVCENAQGDEAADAQGRKVARGILGVLRGSIPRFCFEHACKSPAEQAWFLLTVTPLNRDDPSGVVVMYLNITEQKRGEERSRRLGTAMDAIVDAIYLIDRTSMRLVHVNDAACRMQDKTREQLLAMDLSAVLGTSRAEHERIYDALIMNGVGMEPQEMLRERSDGTSGWFEVRRQAQQSGKVWTIVTLVRDITERKAAETRIAYLNRVYSMLSSINVLVVRVHSRDELFKEACRIAVERVADFGWR
jgi:PAS domain S-box-containing protein